MGRKRQSRRDLPERVYQKHGAYYFVDADNKWQKVGKTVSEVYRWYADMVHDDIQINTMSQIMDRYLGEVLPEKAPSTVRNEERAVKRLREVFGDTKPGDIRPVDIYKYQDTRARKNTKAESNNERRTLSNLFACAVKWGLTDKNPVREVKTLRLKTRDRYITDEEFKQLYEKARPKMKCIMDVAYLTALRKGDILKIKLSDLQDGVLQVVTEKTKKKQSFVVEGVLAEAIARAKALRRNVLSTFLFSDRTGKQMDKNNFANMFDTLKKKCNLADVHFHDIRAKSLTDADRQGLNAQLMAGHKNRAMTDRYIKDRQGDRVTPLNRIPI